MSERTLTTAQFLVIKNHNDKLADAAQEQILAIRKIPPLERPGYLLGQLLYWEHYLAAMKHSTAIAAQLARVQKND